MFAWRRAADLSLKISFDNILDSASNACNHIDTKLIEKTHGPLSHAPGDNDLSALISDKSRNLTGLTMGALKRIFHFKAQREFSIFDIGYGVVGTASEMGAHIRFQSLISL